VSIFFTPRINVFLKKRQVILQFIAYEIKKPVKSTLYRLGTPVAINISKKGEKK